MMGRPSMAARVRRSRASFSALQAFGIDIDSQKNIDTIGGKVGEIQSVSSRIKVLVIPTDEELSIAQQTTQVLGTQCRL